MALPTQKTWVCANSGRQWRTGKPGVLHSMGSQRVGHILASERWTTTKQLMGFCLLIGPCLIHGQTTLWEYKRSWRLLDEWLQEWVNKWVLGRWQRPSSSNSGNDGALGGQLAAPGICPPAHSLACHLLPLSFLQKPFSGSGLPRRRQGSRQAPHPGKQDSQGCLHEATWNCQDTQLSMITQHFTVSQTCTYP